MHLCILMHFCHCCHSSNGNGNVDVYGGDIDEDPMMMSLLMIALMMMIIMMIIIDGGSWLQIYGGAPTVSQTTGQMR